LPPLHLLGGAADLSGGRLLYLPSVWFCLLMASCFDGLPDICSSKYLVHGILIATVLLFYFLSLQNNLSAWSVAGKQVEAACKVVSDIGRPVAVTGLPRSIRGAPAFANGFPECVELSSGHQDSVHFVESATVNAELPMLVWDTETQSLHTGPQHLDSMQPAVKPGDKR
ncbi:MAG: hypothetical protein ABI824_04780, partial [Acidobacteriota bacterium]